MQDVIALTLGIGQRLRDDRLAQSLLGDAFGRCLSSGLLLGAFFIRRSRFGIGRQWSRLVGCGFVGCGDEFSLLEPHRLTIGDQQLEDLVGQFIPDFEAQAGILVSLGVEQAILSRQFQQVAPGDFQLFQQIISRGHC